jgi:hypothetical protein
MVHHVLVHDASMMRHVHMIHSVHSTSVADSFCYLLLLLLLCCCYAANRVLITLCLLLRGRCHPLPLLPGLPLL